MHCYEHCSFFDRLGCGSALPFISNGENLKTQRRLLSRTFDQRATKLLRTAQERQVKALLHDISESPNDFRGAVKR